MKKLVFASVVALASVSLVTAPLLRAQNSDQITIQNPAEFAAYQQATTQTDPTAKATALETFLQTYPQSVVKNAVLDLLLDTYFQGLKNQDKTVSAATRLLQVDPNNLKALLYSVIVMKGQCGQKADPQTCDDAAALAQKGLKATKPASINDDDWKKLTTAAYPIFDSTIALDDTVSKKDYAGAIAMYKQELALYSDDQSKTAGLNDSLLLAGAYAQPGATQDLKSAIWFYARVWDFAPPQYKAQIEPKLEYWYKKYHGGLDGLDDIKTQAQASTFPPGTLTITLAKTPAEQIDDLIKSTPDLTKLALADKETVLALGTKEDADKLWAVMKDQPTPIPGVVIEATASQIKLAVTEDAKMAKIPDFIVNLKEPLKDEDIPAAGFEFKLQPETQLNGTYDTYTQIPATATTTQSAQIVMRDGFVQEKKKAAAPVRRKPTPAHHTAQ